MDAVIGPEYQVEYCGGSGASNDSQSSAPAMSQGLPAAAASSVTAGIGSSVQVAASGGTGTQTRADSPAPQRPTEARGDAQIPGAHSESCVQWVVQRPHAHVPSPLHSAVLAQGFNQFVLVPELSGLSSQLGEPSKRATAMAIRFTPLLPSTEGIVRNRR